MNGEGKKGTEFFLWGYLPGATLQRSPLLVPTAVKLSAEGDGWEDVCGGGCGFAMASSETGNLITWGSADDLGHSYVASGRHGETPEAFPLPTESSIVKAAAGWAHCVAVTEHGKVYTWGWKECVPSGKDINDHSVSTIIEKDVLERQSRSLIEKVSPRSQPSKNSGTVASSFDGRSGDESTKRRLSSNKHAESSSLGKESLSAVPCLVVLNPGVRVAAVSAGARHT